MIRKVEMVGGLNHCFTTVMFWFDLFYNIILRVSDNHRYIDTLHTI